MIDNQTLFNVCDNSGVKNVKCYKISKYSAKKIGTIIFVIIKKTKSSEKLKSGSVTKAVIVRTKIIFNRLNGNFFSFLSNDVILINDKKEFLNEVVTIQYLFKEKKTNDKDFIFRY